MIELKKGDHLWVLCMRPKNLPDLATQVDETKKWVFKTDVVAIVEDLSENGLTCKHIRFIREAREGTPSVGGQKWPRLRRALTNLGTYPKMECLGGWNPIVYQDEIGVADYHMSGSHGWIVRKRDISKLLGMLPLEEERVEQLRAKKEELVKSIRPNHNVAVWTILFRWFDSARPEWVILDVDGYRVGVSCLKENPSGDSVYNCDGRHYILRYRRVPEGLVHHVIENSRWLCLLENHLPASWESVRLEMWDDGECFPRVVSREEAEKFWERENATELSRIRQELSRIHV